MYRASSARKRKIHATGALALAVLLPAVALTTSSGPAAAAQRSCAEIADDLQFNLNMFGQMAGSGLWNEAFDFALQATRTSGEYYGAGC
jgi:hypothetical protein